LTHGETRNRVFPRFFPELKLKLKKTGFSKIPYIVQPETGFLLFFSWVKIKAQKNRFLQNPLYRATRNRVFTIWEL